MHMQRTARIMLWQAVCLLISCYMTVLCQHSQMYQTFCCLLATSFQFPTQTWLQNCDLNRRLIYQCSMHNSQFSTNNSLCLGNDTRQSHSYYGMSQTLQRATPFALKIISVIQFLTKFFSLSISLEPMKLLISNMAGRYILHSTSLQTRNYSQRSHGISHTSPQ